MEARYQVGDPYFRVLIVVEQQPIVFDLGVEEAERRDADKRTGINTAFGKTVQLPDPQHFYLFKTRILDFRLDSTTSIPGSQPAIGMDGHYPQSIT